MDDDTRQALQQNMKLRFDAERLLGQAAWYVVESYGKVTAGPSAGQYVALLTGQEKLDIASQLIAGRTVPVHLMHRRETANGEVSSLRWHEGRLVMVFTDREEQA